MCMWGICDYYLATYLSGGGGSFCSMLILIFPHYLSLSRFPARLFLFPLLIYIRVSASLFSFYSPPLY
jgi:hypothetical protein